MAVPLLDFFALAGGALLRLPVRLVLDGLLFEVIESLVDRDGHVLGLSQADQRAVARADGDFGFVAVLFDGEDHLGFKSIAQNFADLGEAGFNFFADSVGDFVLSSGVFHIHERPLRRILFQVNRAPHCSRFGN